MKTMVILIHPVSKAEFEYEENHAQRILDAGTGWKKKRSKARKTKSDGVITGTDTKNTKGTGTPESDSNCGCS